MIKVNKVELIKAVEKAATCSKESFIFNITERKATDGRSYATVSASNGNSQVIACFMAKAEKALGFIVGKELPEVLRAVGEFGDEIAINVTDSVAEITCGSASLPLGLLPDGTMIKMQTPNDSKCTYASFNRDEFVKSVRKGSFAYGDGSSASSLISTVALLPVTKDENKLCIISSDGKISTRSYATAIEVNDEFKNVTEYVSVDAPALQSFCTKLEGEKINLLIFDKQVTIKDGNDFYTIIRYETKFPEAVGQLLDAVDYNYKGVFDVASLRAAFKVATILENKNDKKALITIQNGKVTISSELLTNKASIKAENVEGEVSILVNEKHIDMALKNMDEKVTIYGLGELKPLYITADGVQVMTAPIRKSGSNQ